ncbi:MAG: hypothetical protein IT348_14145, partial [Candidatus Eisenbacteria bacterium]|nr:hypothetical protein [Candidatus Eisenbacteria bacterium]
ARAGGRTREQATESVLADPEVLRLRSAITGGTEAEKESFAVYLVDWFVRRAWAEAAGPLDDSIPSAP